MYWIHAPPISPVLGTKDEDVVADTGGAAVSVVDSDTDVPIV